MIKKLLLILILLSAASTVKCADEQGIQGWYLGRGKTEKDADRNLLQNIFNESRKTPGFIANTTLFGPPVSSGSHWCRETSTDWTCRLRLHTAPKQNDTVLDLITVEGAQKDGQRVPHVDDVTRDAIISSPGKPPRKNAKRIHRTCEDLPNGMTTCVVLYQYDQEPMATSPLETNPQKVVTQAAPKAPNPSTSVPSGVTDNKQNKQAQAPKGANSEGQSPQLVLKKQESPPAASEPSAKALPKLTSYKMEATGTGQTKNDACQDARAMAQLGNVYIDDESLRKNGGVPASTISECDCSSKVSTLIDKKYTTYTCKVSYLRWSDKPPEIRKPVEYKGGGTIAK